MAEMSFETASNRGAEGKGGETEISHCVLCIVY